MSIAGVANDIITTFHATTYTITQTKIPSAQPMGLFATPHGKGVGAMKMKLRHTKWHWEAATTPPIILQFTLGPWWIS